MTNRLIRDLSRKSARGLKVLALSDVAFGYGSPQIFQLLTSILDRFPVARCIAVEPDQKGRRPRAAPDKRVEIVRLVTQMPPYDQAFLAEFSYRASELIEAFEPDIVIATHGFVLPPILMQRKAPPVFIYYMLESISHQTHGMGDIAIELNRRALADANLVLAPEKRRVQADFNRFGWRRDDILEVLNVGLLSKDASTPIGDRKRRILHAGSLGQQTLNHFMLHDDLSDIEFDVAGPADTAEGREFLHAASSRPNIRYLGMLSGAELAERRKEYAYALAMWRPDNINQLFASPNKFFESIAAGVPPIAGPHPQCADILAKYNCGVVMMDWTQSAFNWTVQTAMAAFDAAVAGNKHWFEPGYSAMVKNCKNATQKSLNWEAQIAPALQRLADLPQVRAKLR